MMDEINEENKVAVQYNAYADDVLHSEAEHLQLFRGHQ